MSRIQFFPDVATAIGPVVDARAYGAVFNGTTLQAAITAIGGASRTLRIPPGAWSIASNLVVPATIKLFIDDGAILTVATGITLTINGDIVAGKCQIFDWVGTGAIVFGAGAVDCVYPEWFGDIDGTADEVQINKAIASIAAGGIVRLSYEYTIADELLLTNNNQHLIGQGPGLTKITQATAGKRVIASSQPAPNLVLYRCSVKSMYLYSAQDNVAVFDWTGFCYSAFADLLLHTAGTNGIACYAAGATSGYGPYYNSFHNIELSGSAIGVDHLGQAGLRMASSGIAWRSAPGPNANFFSNFHRIHNFEYGIDIQSGVGNHFSNIALESQKGKVFRFGYKAAADYSGTLTGVTSNTTFTDAVVPVGWTNNCWTNSILVMTSGVAAGERATITSNDIATGIISLMRPLLHTPAVGDTYDLYFCICAFNTFRGVYVEGSTIADFVLFDYSGRGNSLVDTMVNSLTSVETYNSDYGNVVVRSGYRHKTYLFTGAVVKAGTVVLSPTSTGIAADGGVMTNKGQIVAISIKFDDRGGDPGEGTLKVYNNTVLVVSYPGLTATESTLKVHNSTASPGGGVYKQGRYVFNIFDASNEGGGLDRYGNLVVKFTDNDGNFTGGEKMAVLIDTIEEI
jgi:hypothetical protein